MSEYSNSTLESMSQAVWYNRWTLNQFSKYLSGDILEIGCGIGNFSQYLINYGNLTAMDVNKEYVNEAKDKIKGRGEIGIGDIERGEFFFKSKNFNSVVCINVLEHIKDDKKALNNIYNLLIPNGYLILLVPAHNALFNSIDNSIGHFRRYEKESLLNLLNECKFTILKCKSLNFVGGIGWFIAGKLFKDKTVSEGKIKIFNALSPFFLTLEKIITIPFGTSLLIIAKKDKK